MGALLEQLKTDLAGIETADEDFAQLFRWSGVVLTGHLDETGLQEAFRDAGFEDTAELDLVARSNQFNRTPARDDEIELLGDRQEAMRVLRVRKSPDGLVYTIALRKQNAADMISGGASGEAIVMPDGIGVVMP